MVQALAYAVQLLGVLPGLISAGKDVADLIKTSAATLSDMQSSGRDPTALEWQALNDYIADLQADLHSGSNPVI